MGELVDIWFNGAPDNPSIGFRNRRNRPLSPTTIADFHRRIATHISLIANHDIRNLDEDPLILDRFLNEALTTENARKAFMILNLAFKAAMRGKLGPALRIRANPCDAHQLAPVNPTARGVPTAAEVAKILIAAADDGREWEMFCRLTATLGTRRGETCALRANDFDIDQRRVHIDESAANSLDGGVVLKPPKSWEPRTLIIAHEPFWETVSDFIVRLGKRDFLFNGWVRARGPSTRSANKCWHPSSASHRFAAMMKTIGLVARDTGRPYSLHSLRHFVATALYNQSHDWVQVAKFLGHKSPAITMRLYANHILEDAQRELGDMAAAPWWGEGDALVGADAISRPRKASG